jgi:hypothetical protein
VGVTGEDVSGSAQTTFSPRAQFAIKPDWEKDMVFRVSGGLYHQPPTESLGMLTGGSAKCKSTTIRSC